MHCELKFLHFRAQMKNKHIQIQGEQVPVIGWAHI